jgi:predicted O-methyltransferase YrrM
MLIPNRLQTWLGQSPKKSVVVEFVKRQPGILSGLLSEGKLVLQTGTDFERIERCAADTERLGIQPLWEGYRDVFDYPRRHESAQRTSDQVRSSALAGRFFAWLTARREPNVIVEFGTAFGVSGMYWLAGLERNQRGRLLTFEPNEIWAKIADRNLASISDRYHLTIGTFEESIENALRSGEEVDIAFVDAIHTSEFVFRQFQILVPRMRTGGLILFDDINFSSEMAQCWMSLASHPQVRASASIDGHVGIVELVAPR